MYTNNKLSKAVRLAIAFGAVSATAFTASVNAAEEEEVAKVERIEVTGSRLRSTDLQGFSPVQVIDGSDIDTSSVANIQELLLKNPFFLLFLHLLVLLILKILMRQEKFHITIYIGLISTIVCLEVWMETLYFIMNLKLLAQLN